MWPSGAEVADIWSLAGTIPPSTESPLMVEYHPKALGPQQTNLEVQVLASTGNTVVWSRPIFVSGLSSSSDGATLVNHSKGTRPAAIQVLH